MPSVATSTQPAQPKLGHARCYWSLLSADLHFIYLDPVLASHLGDQANELIGKSLIQFVHPEEQASAESDLGGVLESKTMHGSITRVRFCRLSRVRRLLGYTGSTPPLSSTPDYDKVSIDSNYIALDIVINWACTSLVLCFLHAVVDLTPSDNDERHKTKWTNWCGTPYLGREEVELIYRRLWALFPNPSPQSGMSAQVEMDGAGGRRVFQILGNDEGRGLLFSWPPDPPQSATHDDEYPGGTAKDFARLVGEIQIGFGSDETNGSTNATNASTNEATTSCTRRYKATLSLPTVAGDVESVFIPHGSVIFACHKTSPYTRALPPSSNIQPIYTSQPQTTQSQSSQGSPAYYDYPPTSYALPPVSPSYAYLPSQHPQAHVPSQHPPSHISSSYPQQQWQEPPAVGSGLGVGYAWHTPSNSPVLRPAYSSGTSAQSAQSITQGGQAPWPQSQSPYADSVGLPLPLPHAYQPRGISPDSYVYASASGRGGEARGEPRGEPSVSPDLVPPPRRRVSPGGRDVYSSGRDAYSGAGGREVYSSSTGREYGGGSAGVRDGYGVGSGSRNAGNRPVGVIKCTSCKATSSPEWRKGPSGKKELCNACGLRYARSRAKKEGHTTVQRRRKEKAQAQAQAQSIASSIKQDSLPPPSPPTSASYHSSHAHSHPHTQGHGGGNGNGNGRGRGFDETSFISTSSAGSGSGSPDVYTHHAQAQAHGRGLEGLTPSPSPPAGGNHVATHTSSNPNAHPTPSTTAAGGAGAAVAANPNINFVHYPQHAQSNSRSEGRHYSSHGGFYPSTSPLSHAGMARRAGHEVGIGRMSSYTGLSGTGSLGSGGTGIGHSPLTTSTMAPASYEREKEKGRELPPTPVSAGPPGHGHGGERTKVMLHH